jgi:putative ABC transport system permease protein
MFFTYLFRELSKRKKQTALISSGLAVAIALVIVVNSVGNGIKVAQQQALSGLYGIGTDISVTKTTVPSFGGGMRFAFGGGAGNASGDSRVFSRSRLSTSPFTGTFSKAQVTALSAVFGVTATVPTLKLNSTTFNGQIPQFIKDSTSGATGAGGNGQQPPGFGGGGAGLGRLGGGADGNGGSAFNVSSFTVEGVGGSISKVGPLAAVAVKSGRNLSAADTGSKVVVIDSGYASANKLKVGSSLTIASASVRVVGIVASTSTSATTPSNVYLPIDVAQSLSGQSNVYSNLYVSADSSANLAAIKAQMLKVVKGATVSTASELASTVSGSLATASSLVNDMGGWLSVIVLLAAFITAILFTTSGVNRRVREFGTLKAIGWRSSRVVRQILGESLVSGLVAAVSGILLGLGGVWAVNSFAPTLSATVASATQGFPRPGGGGFGGGGFGGPAGGMGGGGFRGMGQAADSAVKLTLHASIDPSIIWVAIGFALLGGILAGTFGGLRAARLSPATALRSLD